MDQWGLKYVELTYVMNTNSIIKKLCVSCWTAYISKLTLREEILELNRCTYVGQNAWYLRSDCWGVLNHKGHCLVTLSLQSRWIETSCVNKQPVLLQWANTFLLQKCRPALTREGTWSSWMADIRCWTALRYCWPHAACSSICDARRVRALWSGA